MSYESVFVLLVIFLVLSGFYVVTRIISSRQHERDEQADLDMIFSAYVKGSGINGVRLD